MFPDLVQRLAEKLVELCADRDVLITCAESCTGGLIAGAITDIAGSSACLDRGFVTYSNAAKQDMLRVAATALRDHGAVSEAVARAMAEGALAQSRAAVSVAVTGIAGPGGGHADKPVGLVWFATAARNGPSLSTERRFGDIGRNVVRLKTVETALGLLLDRVDGTAGGST